MPVVGPALSALIQTNVDSNMGSYSGTHPLSQPNPAYFIALCTAIGTGIATGSPLVSFTTSDSGTMGVPPIPGVGSGTGIVTDSSFMRSQAYTNVRGYILSELGSTSHDSYPPGAQNSGQFLDALCKGVADAVKTHFATAWILVSAHPTIYAGSGTISNGNFSGLSSSLVKSSIVAAGPTLLGSFFPKLAQGIAEAYVDTIQLHSTGSVTISGVCVPGPSQVCGISSSGSGTGTAT